MPDIQKKLRLDQLLVEKGFAPSRERAQSLILAGNVLVEDTPAEKPGVKYASDTLIRLRQEDHPFVSRGGLKLIKALEEFKIDANDKIGLDIGASTGGFTDVLLTQGALRIFAVDVGYNQLAWKLRSDPRVIILEKINARSMTFDIIGEQVDLIVVDVSFISLDKILPALLQFARPDTDWVTLIKPQFEVGREKVGKKGIVTGEEDRLESVERISRVAKSLGLDRIGLIDSPITGANGNKEFLAHWKLQ